MIKSLMNFFRPCRPFFLLFLCPLATQASLQEGCYEKLMRGFGGAATGDSVHYFFSAEEIPQYYSFTNEEDSLDLNRARLILGYLGQKVGCSGEDIQARKGEHQESCQKFSGVSSQVICVLERSVGFFILSRDYVDGLNVIFNRWD